MLGHESVGGKGRNGRARAAAAAAGWGTMGVRDSEAEMPLMSLYFPPPIKVKKGRVGSEAGAR